MKRASHLHAGTLGILAIALLLTGFGPLSQDASKSSEPQPLINATGGHAEGSVFQLRVSHTLGDLIGADTVVSVTDVLMDPTTGQALRVLAVTTTCHHGQVLLQQTNSFQKVTVDSSEPLVATVGPFDTGLALAMSAELLADENESVSAFESLLSSGQSVPAHIITIAPTPGLTWGDVSDESALSCVASIAR